VNYPGKGSGIYGSIRWRRPVQLADALRLVRSEYQVLRHLKNSRAYYHRNCEKILQRRREKRFLNFCGPERTVV
jgi:hypothetical protein